MNETFIKWLTTNDTNPYYFQKSNFRTTILRVKKNDDFDYLYDQTLYGSNSSDTTSFNYAGIYCKKDNLIYDKSYCLKDIIGDSENVKDLNRTFLLKQLKETVRSKVEKVVENNQDNLQITNLSSRGLEKLNDYCNYSAKRVAHDYFTKGIELKDITYKCEYKPNKWVQDTLLAYILNSDNYAQKETEAYILNHQESILYKLLCNNAIKKEYKSILNDVQNSAYTIKKIRTAVLQKPSAKTVNVTILKKGIEFTFKTEARHLQEDCVDHYDTWFIVQADRCRFKKTFGLNADYKPQEIICITYKKIILYESKEQSEV